MNLILKLNTVYKVALASGCFVLVLILCSTIAYFSGVKDGKSIALSLSQEKVIEHAKKDAKDWANRPATVDDGIKRLRDAANARRKDNP